MFQIKIVEDQVMHYMAYVIDLGWRREVKVDLNFLRDIPEL